MTLPRGFKTNAERRALDLRAAVGATEDRPLDLVDVATHLGARVVPADSLVSIERLQELERLQAFAFSACTFEIAGQPVIVFNPIRSHDRQASDIAHELAHIVLNHEVSEVQYIAGVPFRTCLPDQEEQATAFGGTLLLPRPMLLNAARRGLSYADLAQRQGVTLEMARFRWNTTGVARQVSSARHR